MNYISNQLLNDKLKSINTTYPHIFFLVNGYRLINLLMVSIVNLSLSILFTCSQTFCSL